MQSYTILAAITFAITDDISAPCFLHIAVIKLLLSHCCHQIAAIRGHQPSLLSLQKPSNPCCNHRLSFLISTFR